MRRALMLALMLGFAVGPVAAQKKGPPIDVPSVLVRVGEVVASYYARAQSLVCEEIVRLQPLGHDMAPDSSFARRLLYELRVDWHPPVEDTPGEAEVLRTLINVNGRPPRAKDKDGCMDPHTISPDALGMLLPQHQAEYTFTGAGRTRLSGRAAIMLDYRSRQGGPVSVKPREGHEDCFSIELPGRLRGRVWVDADTFEVLRLDEHLAGMEDVRLPPDPKHRDIPTTMVVERLDSTITFHRVTFSDPDETILLPASMDTLTVIRNAGTPRMRTSQSYRNYRRFMTAGRIVQ